MKCPRRNCDDATTHRVRVKLTSGRVIDETLCQRCAHALYFGTLPLPQTVSGSMTSLQQP